MLIATGYGLGPYRIKSIKRGCVCPTYRDSIKYGYHNAPESEPHVHIVCTKPDGTEEYYINHYSEETLQAVDRRYDGTDEDCAVPASRDHLIILENDQPVQLDLL